MLDQLMQYGILAAVLIFGLKIGLALGFSGIKKKTVGYILIGYGVGLTVLSYLAQPYTEILYNFVYNYTSYIFAVIAVIILVTGFKTIHDWKVTGKDVGSATSMAVVAPCPCCFGAILTTILLVAPMSTIPTVSLGAISAVALVVVMGVTYLLSGKIVQKVHRPYPIVLGDFMIFMGMYFVLCLMILPNIELVTVGTPIEIQSITSVLKMVVVIAVIMIIGVIYAKKRDEYIQY